MDSIVKPFTFPPTSTRARMRASSPSPSLHPLPSPKPLISPSHFSHPSPLLLELCSDVKELHQTLPLIIKSGLSTHSQVQSKLISLFSKFGHLHQATLVLDGVDSKDDGLYHTILKGHANHSPIEDGLSFYTRMMRSDVRPIVYNVTYLLKNCGDNADLKRGMEIHTQLIAHGFESNIFAMTAMMNLYAKCSQIDNARKMFDRMPHKDLTAWNAIIAGYAQNGFAREALELVYLMQEAGEKPDSITLLTALPACVDIGSLRFGRSLHSYSIRAGFELLESNMFAMTTMINLYANCKQIDNARKMFDRMPQKDLTSWNAIIAGYAQNGFAREALELVYLMQKAGEKPDSITLVTMLPACADIGSLRLGRSIHSYAIRAGFESLVNISTALSDMYWKCDAIGIGRLVFDRTLMRDVVSWNSLINGYVQSGNAEEAMKLFKDMLEKGIKPTDVTIMAALQACGELGDLEQGKYVHQLSVQIGLESDVSVMNSLIDMYSKCKMVDTAAKIFENLKDRTLVSWNAMILGFAQNGHPSDALNLFGEMQRLNVMPDAFTLVSVIRAVVDVSMLRLGKWIHGFAIRSCLEKNVFVMIALVCMYAKCGGIHIALKLFNTTDEQQVPTHIARKLFDTMDERQVST